MVFYDLLRIIKGILYYFGKILKYLIFAVLLVFLVGFILLIFGSTSKAETIIPVEVIAKSNEWNFDNCVVFEDSSGNLYIPKSTKYNAQFTQQQTGHWSLRNATVDGVTYEVFVNPVYYIMQFYRYDGNNTFTQVNMAGFNTNSRIDKNYLNRNLKVVYATQDVVYTSYAGKTNGDVYFSSSFIKPEFLNAQDTNWGNSLVTDDFNYFFIDGYSAGNGTVPLTFTVINITMFNQNNGLLTSSFTQQFDLTPDSSYRYMVDNGMYQYAIPKDELKFGYMDNTDYKFVLSWQSEGNTGSNNWDITTDFSADSTLTDEQRDRIKTLNSLNNIYNGINNTNKFLTNGDFNSSTISSNMPSVNIPSNLPASYYLDTFFNNLMAIFTDDDYTDIEFTFPFSQHTITIPSDLVESHLPSAIVIIIQTFYWFLISMYIFKDIWHIVDGLRQGDFFTASEKDIKTEVL